MDQAYDDTKREGWSREPIVEMLIPSTLGDSLAPQGLMWRACSASTCSRSSPMAAPGMIIARRWPT
jgi:hypothetical protein